MAEIIVFCAQFLYFLGDLTFWEKVLRQRGTCDEGPCPWLETLDLAFRISAVLRQPFSISICIETLSSVYAAHVARMWSIILSFFRNLLAATPRGFVDNMLNQNECWRAYRLIVLLSVKHFGKQLFLIILYFNLFAFVRLLASSWFVECHLFIFPPHMTVSFVHIIFFQS